MKKLVLITTLLLATLVVACGADGPAGNKPAPKEPKPLTLADRVGVYHSVNVIQGATVILTINADGTGAWFFEGDSSNFPIVLKTTSGDSVTENTTGTVFDFMYKKVFPVEITFYNDNLDKATMTASKGTGGETPQFTGGSRINKTVNKRGYLKPSFL